ncbi:MAG TPA: ribonuclease HII [Bacteroidia bacterium]|nr:ribonuclease HII [Bacteroidia bacterium]
MLKKYFSRGETEAGCDEAGRGCLAGPVFAAAVILPKKINGALKKLDDSKKLSDKERRVLRVVIEGEALAWNVASCSHEDIDSINILNASFLSMNRAVEKLSVQPQLLLIDGNRFRTHLDIPFQCIVKGDTKFMPIAAASILAKTYRDDFMLELHEHFPHYQWNKNKGYATESHRRAILEFGFAPFHRKSFHIREEQFMMEF